LVERPFDKSIYFEERVIQYELTVIVSFLDSLDCTLPGNPFILIELPYRIYGDVAHVTPKYPRQVDVGFIRIGLQK
jgi:hypothetical protein